MLETYCNHFNWARAIVLVKGETAAAFVKVSDHANADGRLASHMQKCA